MFSALKLLLYCIILKRAAQHAAYLPFWIILIIHSISFNLFYNAFFFDFVKDSTKLSNLIFPLTSNIKKHIHIERNRKAVWIHEYFILKSEQMDISKARIS